MFQLEIRKHLTLTLKLIKPLLKWSLQHLFHLYAEMLVRATGPIHAGGNGRCDQPYADKIILLSACLAGIASGAGNVESNNDQCWVLKIGDVKGTFGLVPYSTYTSYLTYRLASLVLCKHLKMGFWSTWVLRQNCLLNGVSLVCKAPSNSSPVEYWTQEFCHFGAAGSDPREVNVVESWHQNPTNWAHLVEGIGIQVCLLAGSWWCVSLMLVQLIDRSATGTKFHEYERFVWQMIELHLCFAFLCGLHPEFSVSPYFTACNVCEICQVLGGELEKKWTSHCSGL